MDIPQPPRPFYKLVKEAYLEKWRCWSIPFNIETHNLTIPPQTNLEVVSPTITLQAPSRVAIVLAKILKQIELACDCNM